MLPINVTTMSDLNHTDDDTIVEDLINQPKLTTPGRVPALQLTAKGLAHPLRILCERAADELPTGDGHSFRQ